MLELDQQRALLDRAAQGDRLAAEELLLAHYDRLLAHIGYTLPTTVKSVASPEDILHETFRKAFVALRSFQPEREDALYAWLRLIADNTVRDLLRCMKYEDRSVRSPQTTGPDDIRGSAFLPSTEPMTPGGTPVQEAQRQELVRAFHSALRTLPDEYREAIRLCYIDGVSLEEAARKLNRSSDAVRSICHRAKKQIQATINRLSLYIE
jgi:RNA polymerase sigma-70 factor (ECF subfamily)